MGKKKRGRPPKFKEELVDLRYKLPRSLKIEFDKRAEEEGLVKSELIRKIITQYLEGRIIPDIEDSEKPKVSGKRYIPDFDPPAKEYLENLNIILLDGVMADLVTSKTRKEIIEDITMFRKKVEKIGRIRTKSINRRMKLQLIERLLSYSIIFKNDKIVRHPEFNEWRVEIGALIIPWHEVEPYWKQRHDMGNFDYDKLAND